MTGFTSCDNQGEVEFSMDTNRLRKIESIHITKPKNSIVRFFWNVRRMYLALFHHERVMMDLRDGEEFYRRVTGALQGMIEMTEKKEREEERVRQVVGGNGDL